MGLPPDRRALALKSGWKICLSMILRNGWIAGSLLLLFVDRQGGDDAQNMNTGTGNGNGKRMAFILIQKFLVVTSIAKPFSLKSRLSLTKAMRFEKPLQACAVCGHLIIRVV